MSESEKTVPAVCKQFVNIPFPWQLWNARCLHDDVIMMSQTHSIKKGLALEESP